MSASDLDVQATTPDSPEALIALSRLRRLETYHERIVAEMEDDDTARHSQIVLWAVDADRLLQARQLLESVDLEGSSGGWALTAPRLRRPEESGAYPAPFRLIPERNRIFWYCAATPGVDQSHGRPG